VEKLVWLLGRALGMPQTAAAACKVAAYMEAGERVIDCRSLATCGCEC
jgi:hypothetical protein